MYFYLMSPAANFCSPLCHLLPHVVQITLNVVVKSCRLFFATVMFIYNAGGWCCRIGYTSWLNGINSLRLQLLVLQVAYCICEQFFMYGCLGFLCCSCTQFRQYQPFDWLRKYFAPVKRLAGKILEITLNHTQLNSVRGVMISLMLCFCGSMSLMRLCLFCYMYVEGNY